MGVGSTPMQTHKITSSGFLRFGQMRRKRNEATFRHYTDHLAGLLEPTGNPGDLNLACECGHHMCHRSVAVHPDLGESDSDGATCSRRRASRAVSSPGSWRNASR